MSYPQSFVEQLLSFSTEEALKFLDFWRASHLGNKRVVSSPSSISIGVDTTSNEKYDPIIYEQVFRPPPPKLREPNKLYGKDFLLKEGNNQHRVLYSNYGFVRGWFAKHKPFGDLRNNMERKNTVLDVIRKNKGELKPVIVARQNYHWKEEDVYTWAIKSLAAKRKWRKKKPNNELSSSTPMIEKEKDDDDDNQEFHENDGGESELGEYGSLTKLLKDACAQETTCISIEEEEEQPQATHAYRNYMQDEEFIQCYQEKDMEVNNELDECEDHITKLVQF
ncbi:hypothetical protein GOP47_0000018 [Adiantum capillus-veneris]|uniref:Uncharacterized protein n=1 Tax=Adiantum capillus-veneris TaxID=13818 RepID=A0A9D4VCI6_ADICA|nr:hypothetical protein GOP47_0000018 [Adiantum capillus-veneris]